MRLAGGLLPLVWAVFDSTFTWGAVFGAANLTIFIVACIAAYAVFKAEVKAKLVHLKSVADELKESQKREAEQHQEIVRELKAAQHEHEKQDERMFHEIHNKITDLVAGVQRLVGQNDVFRRNEDRRNSS